MCELSCGGNSLFVAVQVRTSAYKCVQVRTSAYKCLRVRTSAYESVSSAYKDRMECHIECLQ